MNKFTLSLFSFLVATSLIDSSVASAAPQCTPWVEYSEDAKLSEPQILYFEIAMKLRGLSEGKNFRLKTPADLAEHKKTFYARVAKLLDYLGYGYVTPEEALTCANTGGKVDYDLLRLALQTGLKQYYIF